MKVAMAQINTTVGDLAGNEAKILAAYSRAHGEGLDLVMFPSSPETLKLSTVWPARQRTLPCWWVTSAATNPVQDAKSRMPRPYCAMERLPSLVSKPCFPPMMSSMKTAISSRRAKTRRSNPTVQTSASPSVKMFGMTRISGATAVIAAIRQSNWPRRAQR